jgi:hypothetical protein
MDSPRDGPPRPGHRPQMSRDALSRDAVYARTPCGILTLSPGSIGNVSATAIWLDPQNTL